MNRLGILLRKELLESWRTYRLPIVGGLFLFDPAVPDVQVWRSTSETVGVGELAAESPYLLLSYLFDWSSTCTNELSELNARRDELLATGVAPYGISRDSPWSHVAWTQALDIEVPLLSDWTGDAVRALGITQEFRGLPDVARRAALRAEQLGAIDP